MHSHHFIAAILFEPNPLSGEGMSMSHTGKHTFVLLITMLRVLVGSNMRKYC